MDYKPQDPKEEAYFAIAERKFSKCLAIGESALDPLLDFFNRYYWAPPETCPDEALMQIPSVLAKIGSRKAVQALREELETIANKLSEWEFYAFLTAERGKGAAILEAVGKACDEFAIPALDKIISRLEELRKKPDNETYLEEIGELKAAVEKAKTAIKEKLKK